MTRERYIRVRQHYSLALLWEPRDLWVGVYWTFDQTWTGLPVLAIYLCLIPCLPLRLFLFYGPIRKQYKQ